MKYLALIALVGSLFLVFAPLAQAVEWLPLVPCGLNPPENPADRLADSYYQPCNRCDLLKLLKNLIDMMLFGVTAPLATLFFVFAGLLYILSGANQGLASRARSIGTNTFYALLIIGGAWLIVNTLLRSFADENIATDWWKLTCSTTVQPTATPPPTRVPGQSQAQALLAAGVQFSTDADCGDSYHARGTIEAIAQGQYPSVCSPSCSCAPGGPNGNVTVSTAILDGLLALKNSGVSFTVTSLTTGRHSAGSAHYTGHAVDIVPSSTDRADWQRVRSFLNSKGGTAICEGSDGQDIPDCNAGRVNHIHWTR